MHDRGIDLVEHLYDYRVREFYTFNQIKQLYDLENTEFLKYYTLIQSIPLHWKEKLKTEAISYQQPEHLILLINKQTKICRFIYSKLILLKSPANVKSIIKWEAHFEKELDFKSIFVKPLLLTNDTKLREFQYKYLMRIIPNNSFLLKCRLKPSNLCDFCCMTIDSNIHMFWECTTIQTFWHDLKFYIETTINTPSGIDYIYEKISFCNILDGNLPTSVTVNFITLLAKFFIFKNKNQSQIPTIHNFKAYIQRRLNIEEMIAISKNKLNIFREQFQTFLTNTH